MKKTFSGTSVRQARTTLRVAGRLLVVLALVTGCPGLAGQAWAQVAGTTPALLEPSATQYLQNQYLANPAMAGLDTGLHINAAYRRQWSDVQGSPTTKFLTADYYAGARVGVGLNIFNDQAGLIQRTRVGGSYAYHLPLADDGVKKLHFGLTLAFNTAYIDRKNINGDNSDPSIGRFNQRDNYFEAEYGMAYTDKHLTIQGALPNVFSLFKKEPNDAVNGGTIYYTAIGYRFLGGNAVTSVEPKIAYRGVKGYDNIWDFGANVAFLHNAFSVTGLYHTTKSFTAGVGFQYKNLLRLQGYYTSQTGGIKTYVDGTYEVALLINLFN